MKKFLLVAIVFVPGFALAQLEWRVSVKLILDANGNRPASGNFITGVRFKVATGRTRFVAGYGDDVAGDGSSRRYRTVAKGVAEAALGDVVLVMGGNYIEPQTITKAVTLRATRGVVSIALVLPSGGFRGAARPCRPG